jgi:hypothetical protein
MPTGAFACAVPHAGTHRIRPASNPAIILFVISSYRLVRSQREQARVALSGHRRSPRRVVRAFLVTCHPSRIALQNSHSRLASNGWQLDRCGKKSSQTACPYGITVNRGIWVGIWVACGIYVRLIAVYGEVGSTAYSGRRIHSAFQTNLCPGGDLAGTWRSLWTLRTAGRATWTQRAPRMPSQWLAATAAG